MCFLYDVCDLLAKLDVIDDSAWRGLRNVVIDG
jgi:hypothetical protein